jgi:hypothetical protein
MGNWDYSVRNQRGDNKPYLTYAHVELTTSGAISDYDMVANSSLFSNLTTANEILVRAGADDFSVKFNSVDNDSIPIDATAAFGVGSLVINNLYITCSGATTIRVYVAGWK